jgi:hypothetical protein
VHYITEGCDFHARCHENLKCTDICFLIFSQMCVFVCVRACVRVRVGGGGKRGVPWLCFLRFFNAMAF